MATRKQTQASARHTLQEIIIPDFVDPKMRNCAFPCQKPRQQVPYNLCTVRAERKIPSACVFATDVGVLQHEACPRGQEPRVRAQRVLPVSERPSCMKPVWCCCIDHPSQSGLICVNLQYLGTDISMAQRFLAHATLYSGRGAAACPHIFHLCRLDGVYISKSIYIFSLPDAWYACPLCVVVIAADLHVFPIVASDCKRCGEVLHSCYSW